MSHLVPFAGDELPRRRKPNAYTLFLMGYDTFDIAQRLGVTEAVASRQVYERRCREKGLPVAMERPE